MTEEQMFSICSANATNRYICQHLDEKTMDMCIEMLLKLDANEFKEINPDAEFDFSCLPIPYSSLVDAEKKQTNFSQEITSELDRLLNNINTFGTNKEYGYLFLGDKDSNSYSECVSMGEGSTQSVQYDWEKIKVYLQDKKNDKVSIFHTHPKPIEKQHNTLYNKHKDMFAKFGVKPDGLNISLSDIYANQYLDMLCHKLGRDDVEAESIILMHNGMLISFSTKNGVSLTGETHLSLDKENEEPTAE